jgi:hypothetical protein
MTSACCLHNFVSQSYTYAKYGTCQSQSQSHVTNDGQLASLFWCQAPIWAFLPHFSYCQTVAVFYVGRPLWWENGSAVNICCWSSPAQSFLGPSPAGLVTIFYHLTFETPPAWRTKSPYLYSSGTRWPSYTPRQWVSFSSPPTTRRATVEAFESASTRRATGTRDITSGRTPQKTPLPTIRLLLQDVTNGAQPQRTPFPPVRSLVAWRSVTCSIVASLFIVLLSSNVPRFSENISQYVHRQFIF